MSVQPSTSWNFTWGGDPFIVPDTLNVPTYRWFPDAHFAMVKNNKQEENDPNSAYIMFWSAHKNYRSVGPTPYPEDQIRLDPQEPIYGGRFDADAYNNGGMWLKSVFRKSDIHNNTTNTDTLIGFYHAEDHWFPRTVGDDHYSWKSMGTAISYDNGYTWENRGQIITKTEAKPEIPEKTTGAGDGTMIWHETDKRWICYFPTGGAYIHMAMSEDPEGAPGTWYKYYNGTFSQPGLRGLQTPVEGLQSLRGSNPSIHFNTYLGLWIMVYHGYHPFCIYMSSSSDAYNWSSPQEIRCSSKEGGKAWYPTIIGESDVLAGQTARLYYADIPDKDLVGDDIDKFRDFAGETIYFTRLDDEMEPDINKRLQRKRDRRRRRRKQRNKDNVFNMMNVRRRRRRRKTPMRKLVRE